MATQSLTVVARTAWWLPLYLHGMALTCALMGTEPDWEKVEKMVLNGIRLKISEE